TVGGATLAAERIQRSKPHSLTVITRPRKSVCNRHVHLPKNVREGDTNTASRITDAVSARSTIDLSAIRAFTHRIWSQPTDASNRRSTPGVIYCGAIRSRA